MTTQKDTLDNTQNLNTLKDEVGKLSSSTRQILIAFDELQQQSESVTNTVAEILEKADSNQEAISTLIEDLDKCAQSHLDRGSGSEEAKSVRSLTSLNSVQSAIPSSLQSIFNKITTTLLLLQTSDTSNTIESTAAGMDIEETPEKPSQSSSESSSASASVSISDSDSDTSAAAKSESKPDSAPIEEELLEPIESITQSPEGEIATAFSIDADGDDLVKEFELKLNEINVLAQTLVMNTAGVKVDLTSLDNKMANNARKIDAIDHRINLLHSNMDHIYNRLGSVEKRQKVLIWISSVVLMVTLAILGCMLVNIFPQLKAFLH